MKENILVSSCLLGKRDRYNGCDSFDEQVVALQEKYNLIAVCPEIMGGLSTPRNPAEQKGDKVFDNHGNDVTDAFEKGAKECLELAKKYNCKQAVLKAKSPSCGSKKIYDGTFSKNLIDGNGVTAKLLQENGIQVYTENEFDRL